MPGDGPYRGIYNPDHNLEAEHIQAIKKMEQQIAAEKIGLSIQLPEDPKIGYVISQFSSALPEDIAFYSLGTGILRYESQSHLDSITNSTFYYYNNKDTNTKLTIQLEKDGTAKIDFLDSKKTRARKEADEKRRSERLIKNTLDQMRQALYRLDNLKNTPGKSALNGHLSELEGMQEALQMLIEDIKK